ncbi:hypothetical protein D4764_07G0009660 [Takifugu flavidus]|uniref:Uncharacterized protein n=1 Tax=Takifugu flavidus TaxID=433684 RepID=A0A5C6MXR2_9TELE|nr:hypothetical protein D4764_07G0009660 [Takifugu flavidus]
MLRRGHSGFIQWSHPIEKGGGSASSPSPCPTSTFVTSTGGGARLGPQDVSGSSDSDDPAAPAADVTGATLSGTVVSNDRCNS